MIYQRNTQLEFGEYTSVLQMYPNIGLRDVQEARYRCVAGAETNPDICALPPLVPEKKLPKEIVHPMTDYTHKAACEMPKSERLAALLHIKDDIKMFLPFHLDLDRKIYSCLMSAYGKRENGYLNEENKNLLSVVPPITTSTQDASLIGTAGSGKSTALRLILDRYPKAIAHCVDGYQYIQIPILETTAKVGDIKSVFEDLARRIDIILGTSRYEEQMRKRTTVSKKEAYLTHLIQVFHIGMIVIDEIQSVIAQGQKNSMFDHILSVTAATGVSVLIAGSESAVSVLNKNAWFSRRFSQLGRVSSDIRCDDNVITEQVVQIIWQYQFTKKYYVLKPKIVSTLLEESCCNVDFLTTIFVKAQQLCILSEGKGELALDVTTIRKAAKMFPFAEKLLKEGMETIETEYLQEKADSLSSIMAAAQAERQEEQKELMRKSVTAFEIISKTTTEIVRRITQSGFTDRKLIERLIKMEVANNESFLTLDNGQQTKIILTKMIKAEAEDDKPRKKAKKEPNKTTEPIPQLNSYASIQTESEDHGLEMLRTSVS